MIKNISKTLDECIPALKLLLNDEDYNEFYYYYLDNKGMWHNTLGRWIRNNWGLWQGSELKINLEQLGFTHPDDMSSVIADLFYNHLHNIQTDLEAKVKYYKDYWDKVKE